MTSSSPSIRPDDEGSPPVTFKEKTTVFRSVSSSPSAIFVKKKWGYN